jgi:hypothetical protein
MLRAREAPYGQLSFTVMSLQLGESIGVCLAIDWIVVQPYVADFREPTSRKEGSRFSMALSPSARVRMRPQLSTTEILNPITDRSQGL